MAGQTTPVVEKIQLLIRTSFFNQQESGQPVLTFGKRNKQLFGNRNPFGVAYG